MMNTFNNRIWSFLNPATGKTESVERMDYEWTAIYKDGIELKQFDDSHIFHQIKEIDLYNLHVLRLVSRVTEKTIDIPWSHRKTPIYFTRTLGLNNWRIKIKVYFFGYEELGSKHISAIFPDGNIVQTNDPDSLSIEVHE